jgi:hypothetical protein
MKTKFLSLVAGASLIALAGVANAGQPLVLSNGQMDVVTAGAAATANAGAFALGDFDAVTLTQTATNAVSGNGLFNIAIGQSYSLATAASVLFQAAVAAHSDSAATLP